MLSIFKKILQEHSKERFIKPFYVKDGIANKYNQMMIVPSEEELIKFYDSHNNVKIDWNKKKDEEFFENLIFTMQNYTSNAKDRKNIEKLFSRDDCSILGSDENFVYIMPSSWKACIFMQSFRCGGQGAMWCTGYEKSSIYWESYNEHSVLILLFNKNPTHENDVKYMAQFRCDMKDGIKNPNLSIWDQIDKIIFEYNFKTKINTADKDDYIEKFNTNTLKKMFERAVNLQKQIFPWKFSSQ